MSVDQYITQTYPIECAGRDKFGNKVLDTPVEVKVKISKPPRGNIIESNVECKYNTGGHGQRCKASHPNVDKVGEGVRCPYSFDIPYALEVVR